MVTSDTTPLYPATDSNTFNFSGTELIGTKETLEGWISTQEGKKNRTTGRPRKSRGRPLKETSIYYMFRGTGAKCSAEFRGRKVCGECGTEKPIFNLCGRLVCQREGCQSTYIDKKVDECYNRIVAMLELFGMNRVYQWVLSPDDETAELLKTKEGREKYNRKMRAIENDLGLIGGVKIDHHHRKINEELPYGLDNIRVSPHRHYVGCGFSVGGDYIKEKYGFVFKKVVDNRGKVKVYRKGKQLRNLLRYEFGHVAPPILTSGRLGIVHQPFGACKKPYVLKECVRVSVPDTCNVKLSDDKDDVCCGVRDTFAPERVKDKTTDKVYDVVIDEDKKHRPYRLIPVPVMKPQFEGSQVVGWKDVSQICDSYIDGIHFVGDVMNEDTFSSETNECKGWEVMSWRYLSSTTVIEELNFVHDERIFVWFNYRKLKRKSLGLPFRLPTYEELKLMSTHDKQWVERQIDHCEGEITQCV